MDAVTLGKGNFAHVELATHSITEVKVTTCMHLTLSYLVSRTLRPQDISAPGHFGTIFKPNHRCGCVLSELSLVQSVPTFRRSDAEVSRTTFLVQNCLETVQKYLVWVRSVLVPKFLVAEVSGNPHKSQSSREVEGLAD